jgi:hypothetical protein
MSTPAKNPLTTAQKQNRTIVLGFIIAAPVLATALIISIIDASQHLI